MYKTKSKWAFFFVISFIITKIHSLPQPQGISLNIISHGKIVKPMLSANRITMLQKFSKCEVQAAWCGNFTILLPLTFHVKSNFEKLEYQKCNYNGFRDFQH